MFLEYHSRSDISFPTCFCKISEALLMFNWLILKVSDFNIDHAVTVFDFPKKLTKNLYACGES